ncbi:hypothetical protein VTL71DRAFT_12242 [Oculimacula yallundae]|uniref:N-acetyltransferase domain-containing protein n=1 Tax=Oculimacula yallundae TaxID=86028 RepID=A0ABR4CSN6_9HELO
MSSVLSQFKFREAVDTDGPFIVSTFDAALLYLASIGSHEQWGSVPFSRQEGWVEETMQQLVDSEHHRLTGKKGSGDNGGLRIFVVELECQIEATEPKHGSCRIVDGCRFLLAGVAFVREQWIPSYIAEQSHIQIGDAERASSIYLEVMVSDNRIGELNRGAGPALIRGVREFGRKLGKKVLYVDGWAGNERKLIRSVYLLQNSGSQIMAESDEIE